MATTTESSIPTTLGDLRKGLIDGGFASDEAFEIVRDLLRGGHVAI